MDNYNGYKLKPKEYSIQPNDIIIRVKDGGPSVPINSIGIAKGHDFVNLPSDLIWETDYLDWRAIETRLGQKAVAGDTVYCIKDTGGSCHQHDSFRITDCSNRNFLSPEKDHILLNGTITGQGWNWKAINFVVLIKVDTKEIQEFPCFRRGIENGHVVEFISPKEGTVIFEGKSGLFDLNYTSNTWVDCNDTSVWEPCNDPKEIEEVTPVVVDPFEAKPGDYVEWAEGSRASMTLGNFYKVLSVFPNTLRITDDLNNEDTWSRSRFKRVLDKAIKDPVLISSDDHIDALAYALRMPISHIAIDYSMMNKPTQTNQKSKGKQMNSSLFTDILKLLTQTEQTDLEKAPSTYAFFYNNEGEYEGTARVANESEAKALLQKPEHLGYTMRIYSFSDEFTTQIPVVSTIKPKTVAVKPARKPRAAKA